MNYEDISCCIPMLHDLQDGDFEYDPIRKRIIGFVTRKNTKEPGKRVLRYCPHCGTKLPNLSCIDEFGTDLYADALEEAVGKEFCDITEDEIPEEFKTDEWWKKRGL